MRKLCGGPEVTIVSILFSKCIFPNKRPMVLLHKNGHRDKQVLLPKKGFVLLFSDLGIELIIFLVYAFFEKKEAS
jgi:hypothetical protein